ncbi:hypothetical protein [Frankia gtarii]|uniref:hypothetical protein n=1 Tax=Frankia gtarii TaxID=2950102 RepID=UPI0021C1B2BA|nr:hypothetical protein [Frankia gtarii]
MIEEAHRLLRRPEPGAAGPGAHAVEMFASLLAEVRAYGEGLVVAEQILSKLALDVIKKTAVKIVHRLPALDGRATVGATTNVDDAQSRHLVTLVPGEAAVFTDGMDRPIRVRVRDGRADEDRAGVVLAPITDIIGRRSPTYGSGCRAVPCTLREIRVAQHLLADQSWLTLWVELAVLAHLTGRTVPVPIEEVRAAFAGQNHGSRVVACALSHAVDAAVAARASTLRPTTDQIELVPVCPQRARPDATRERLGLRRRCPALPGNAVSLGPDPAQPDDTVPTSCGRLRQAPGAGTPTGDAVDGAGAGADDGSGGRDPRSPEREVWMRRRIPGRTRAEQLEAVVTWLRQDLRDAAAVAAVTHVTQRPSVLEHAFGPTAIPFADRLTTALEPFTRHDWVPDHLRLVDRPPGARNESS